MNLGAWATFEANHYTLLGKLAELQDKPDELKLFKEQPYFKDNSFAQVEEDYLINSDRL